MGVQDPRLEGALHLLLVQQHLRARARASTARLRVPSAPKEMPSSPPADSDSESSDSEAPKPVLSTEAQPDGWHPPPIGQSSSQRKETLVATQDSPPDKPLDLSDRGRCRDTSKSTGQPLPLSPTPDPQLPALSRPLILSSHTLSNGSTETRAQESEEYSTPKDTSQTLSGIHVGLTSPRRTAEEPGGRPRPGPHLQRPDADGTTAQRPELEQLGESDASDTKAGLISESSIETSIAGEGQHAEDLRRGQQQKRKRASDLQDKAPKKPSQGKRKPKEPLTPADGPRSPRDTEDYSLSPINSCRES